RRGDAGARGGQICDKPSEAVSHCGDFPVASGRRLERLDRRPDVADSQLQIELAPQLARLLDALRRVVKLEIWLDPPEQVGRKRDVSIAGVLLDHVADMRIHAEDFLNDHYAGSSAAPGRRQIAIELSTICSGDRNHLAITHRENS